MDFLETARTFIDSHLAVSSSLAIVLVDVLLRVYPKGVPLLELTGRALSVVGKIFISVSSIIPNRTPPA